MNWLRAVIKHFLHHCVLYCPCASLYHCLRPRLSSLGFTHLWPWCFSSFLHHCVSTLINDLVVGTTFSWCWWTTWFHWWPWLSPTPGLDSNCGEARRSENEQPTTTKRSNPKERYRHQSWINEEGSAYWSPSVGVRTIRRRRIRRGQFGADNSAQSI